MEEKDIYVPIPKTKGKTFQIDDYGNIRIRVKGRSSIWVKYEDISSMVIDDVTYIGVSEHFKGILPTECVLKVEKVDEDGDSGFVKVKISEKEKALDIDEVKSLLSEVIDSYDYIYIIREIKQTTKDTEGFFKIKMFVIPYDKVGVETSCVENFNILDIKGVQEYFQAALSDEYNIDVIVECHNNNDNKE